MYSTDVEKREYLIVYLQMSFHNTDRRYKDVLQISSVSWVHLLNKDRKINCRGP